jgi:RND family efflux transporter MFP subunit
MKQIAIILSLFLLMSCGQEGSSDKKAELDSYRQKVKEYNQKIEALEAELETEMEEAPSGALLPVEVKEIIPEALSRYFEVSGVLEAVQDANISPEMNGQIDRVAVQRGTRVKKGALLVKLNTDITEKSMAEIKTSLELAQRVFDKQEELWQQQIGSEIQYLEAKNAVESLEARLATLEEQLEMAHIRAPFAGIIDDIMVKEGELAAPGVPVVHLVDLSLMRVSARVSEAYLTAVSKGDWIELRFPTYPEDKLKAAVTRLGEVIDPKTRTFTLEVELKNPGEKLKPNMLTSVRIEDFSDAEAKVVPSSILRQDFNGTFLFLAEDRDAAPSARKVYVEKGITVQDKTQILEGLSVGDLVITKGFNLVSDGSPIAIKNL